jgi:plastocyanin
MRFLYFSAIVEVSFIASVFTTVDNARGYDGYYSGGVYYHPAPRVVYYRSYTPMYDARTAYYARPTYSSYDSPCTYYTPPVYRQDAYGEQRAEQRAEQRPDASGYARGQSAPAQPTTVTTIGAYDNRFSPATINVQPGTTVRWVNYGQHIHTITSNDNRWDSGDVKAGATYSATFKHPGTYYYYCRHHTQDRMQGIVVVGSGGGRGNDGTRSSGY